MKIWSIEHFVLREESFIKFYRLPQFSGPFLWNLDILIIVSVNMVGTCDFSLQQSIQHFLF